MTTDPTTSVPFVYAHPHLFAPTEQGPDRRVMGEFTFQSDGQLAATALNAYAGYPIAPHPLGYIPIGEVRAMLEEIAGTDLDPNSMGPAGALKTARAQLEQAVTAAEDHLTRWNADAPVTVPWEPSGPVPSTDFVEKATATLDAIQKRISDIGVVVSRGVDGRHMTALAGRVGELVTELENQATAATTRHQAAMTALDTINNNIGRAHADQVDLRTDVQRLVATMNQLGEAGLLEHPEPTVHDLVAEVPEYDLWRDALMLATASWNHGAGQASPTAIIDRAIQFMPTLRSRAGATGIGPDEMPPAAADVVHAYAEGGVLPCCGRRAITGTLVDVDPRHVTCTGARDQAWPQVFDVLAEAPARMGDARAVVHLRPTGTPLVARCCGKELGVQDQWHYDVNRVTCDGTGHAQEPAPEPRF